MTITPEQAKSLPYSDYPRPWGISHEVIYDARGESDYGWDVGPVTVYDEDLAPLVAAAPDMAEQIAGMRYEYGVQVQDDQGEWKAYEGWGWGADGDYDIILLAQEEGTTWTKSLETATDWLGESAADEARIVRRLVTEPEVID